MARRLTRARIPIIGSEKKKTAVAPGAEEPRNTKAMMQTRRMFRDMAESKKTFSVFSLR